MASSKAKNNFKANGHAHEEKREDSKKYVIPKRVYIHRNSVLTDLMEVNHLQSMYNITVAFCILLFLNAIIFYVVDPSQLWEDLGILKRGCTKFQYFVMFWLLYHVFAFAIYEGFKIWIVARNRINSKVADEIFFVLLLASIGAYFYAFATEQLRIALPPICGFAAGCEQVRIYMKIHSFIRENVTRVTNYNPQKDGNQMHALYPSRKHYLYYLFAPALLYRDSYPRTESRQWGNVFHNLYKFILVLFITYCFFMRYNVGLFMNVGLRPFTTKEAAMIFAGSMVCGSVMMFMMFYGILHCWLNAMAELLKFGDREFYHDWWNSTSFTQYYRRWNIVVHDWLHTYIYTDSQKLGCGRSSALILVFLISALVHEYIIALAFGYFYPVLMVVYSTIGVLLIFITKQRTTQSWNTFMWSMLFSGWGVVITLYTSEWFARINCPRKETSLDFFIPRSWDLSCPIINL